ncbi:hypothetical protein PAPHI01_2586 [Pancytospora philotis]|nr:hypothetical protein PAPHI01_2586 [Pancytospora philotis]
MPNMSHGHIAKGKAGWILGLMPALVWGWGSHSHAAVQPAPMQNQMYDPPQYHPSIQDGLLTLKPEVVKSARGYAKNHFVNSDRRDTFGNRSFMALNAYTESDLEIKRQRKALYELVDTNHPMVFGVHSASHHVIKYFGELAPHYRMAATQPFAAAHHTRKHFYHPILYDAHMLVLDREGVVQADRDSPIFATYAIFSLVNLRGHQLVVVNGDLYSPSGETNKSLFTEILARLAKEGINPAVTPVVYTVTVEALPKELKRALDNPKYDLVRGDVHYKKTTLNTMHQHGRLRDGKQRTYIYLDERSRPLFTSNYARILTDFDKVNFNSYPLFAILAYNNPERPRSKL